MLLYISTPVKIFCRILILCQFQNIIGGTTSKQKYGIATIYVTVIGVIYATCAFSNWVINVRFNVYN